MLIILDRDGVINEDSNEYIKSADEWIPIAGSLEAIAKLKNAGFQVVVATNQSGLSRGLYTEGTLMQIHQKMSQELAQWGVALDGIFYCPHQPKDHCFCRKPEPGLFLTISKQLEVDLTTAVCVGDSLRDIQAAQKVLAKPLLVLTGNGQKTIHQIGNLSIPIYVDLADATHHIIKGPLP